MALLLEETMRTKSDTIAKHIATAIGLSTPVQLGHGAMSLMPIVRGSPTSRTSNARAMTAAFFMFAPLYPGSGFIESIRLGGRRIDQQAGGGFDAD
jgi:hypothetical protein